MKRKLSKILVFIMVIWLLPIANVSTVTATDYGANGKFLLAIAPPEYGSIPISSSVELRKIGNDRNYPIDGKYYLTADIDLSDGMWSPIGGSLSNISRQEFAGIFDGQGHIIRNLTITNIPSSMLNKYFGLFGSASSAATIKNVGLEDIKIDIINRVDLSGSAINVGGIQGGSGRNATIINCYTTGEIAVLQAADLSPLYVGGLSGYGGNIEYCYNEVIISASNNSSGTLGSVGGPIVAGGICGEDGFVSNSYNIGTATASSVNSNRNVFAGGIIGRNTAGFSVSNCYNAGDVIVFNSAANTNRLYAGGIIGYSASNATVRDSYWNIDNVQTLNANLSNDDKKGLGYGLGQATALTIDQMRQQSSFSGWDFTSVWGIKPSVNNGFPVLRAFYDFQSYTITPEPDSIMVYRVKTGKTEKFNAATTEFIDGEDYIIKFTTNKGGVVTHWEAPYKANKGRDNGIMVPLKATALD